MFAASLFCQSWVRVEDRHWLQEPHLGSPGVGSVTKAHHVSTVSLRLGQFQFAVTAGLFATNHGLALGKYE